MANIDNLRNCATCGKAYSEAREVWPQFPQCSLCYPTHSEQERTQEQVFRYYLKFAHGINVNVAVAKEILDAAKSL